MLTCITERLIPLYRKILAHRNVRIIFQDHPPLPGAKVVIADHARRNLHMIAAFNHFRGILYRTVGISVIPACALALPWSEELVQGRTHLMTTGKTGFIITPPGHVSTNLIMRATCEDL